MRLGSAVTAFQEEPMCLLLLPAMAAFVNVFSCVFPEASLLAS
jgi:hypothetical protein